MNACKNEPVEEACSHQNPKKSSAKLILKLPASSHSDKSCLTLTFACGTLIMKHLSHFHPLLNDFFQGSSSLASISSDSICQAGRKNCRRMERLNISFSPWLHGFMLLEHSAQDTRFK